MLEIKGAFSISWRSGWVHVCETGDQADLAGTMFRAESIRSVSHDANRAYISDGLSVTTIHAPERGHDVMLALGTAILCSGEPGGNATIECFSLEAAPLKAA